ncbi:MAG: polyhydroxyalkanoic acid system family protein [bacterium]|nr:polyhydroxyalkanoic acid system family protein [bacterium]
MAKINIIIPHKLTQDEALKRVKKLLKEVKAEHEDKISDLKESWKGNKGTFSFSAMKYDISGTLEVTEKCAELDGDIPWPLGLFKGKIEKMIRERAEKLLK